MAALALLASACLGATAIRVDVSTDVDCGENAPVVIVTAHDTSELQTLLEGAVITSSRSGCSAADGTVGDMVLSPATANDEPVTFAVMTRVDGQPPDHCGDPALPQLDRNQCIVAKRALRFSPHSLVDVQVPLRLSCAGVLCPSDQTCVRGQCVPDACTDAYCTESELRGMSSLVGLANYTSCALAPHLSGVQLQCWGLLDFNNSSSSPASVFEGAGSNAPVAFAANGSWTCVVLRTGQVQCWGDNSQGYLGDGTTQPVSGTVTEQGISDAVSVVQGAEHSCALQQSGNVTCWGSCGWGQCPGATQLVSVPAVVPGLVGATALAAGIRHNCVILKDRSVECWGYNQQGELGTGSTATVDSPKVIAGLSAIDISAGGETTCAVLVDGTVSCWGYNTEGALGDGTTTSRNVPGPVPGLSGVRRVSTSGLHTCALLANGSVFCWGDNSTGALGDGTTTNRLVPTQVPGFTATQIAVGAKHTCGVTAGGVVECWGDNTNGQLGDGTTTARLTPTPVVGL